MEMHTHTSAVSPAIDSMIHTMYPGASSSGLWAHMPPDTMPEPMPDPIGDPMPGPVGDPPLPISPDPTPQPGPAPSPQIPPPPGVPREA